MGLFGKKTKVRVRDLIPLGSVVKAWMNGERKATVFHVGTVEAIQVAKTTVTYKLSGIQNWFTGAERWKN